MLRTICILAAFYCLAFLCSCQKEYDPGTGTPPTNDSTATGEGLYAAYPGYLLGV